MTGDRTDTLVLDENWGDLSVDRSQIEPYLVVMVGHLIGEVRSIQGEIVVGRGADAALRIEDDGISSEHFKLVRRSATAVELIDLGSTNGTRVNGERVQRHMLRDGDKIQLGVQTLIKFTLADPVDRMFQHQMHAAALRDPLTRLYNRRHLEAQLDAEISFSNRHMSPASLIMLDLDHFKQVNDNHGHLVGDSVLRGVAQCIAGAIRKEDIPARYGGEEFAVICRGTSAQMALVAAERIRTLVASGAVRNDAPGLRLTISAGIAQVPRAGIQTSNHLIEAADRALYRAKRGGRNRVCIFSEEHDGLPEQPG